ncbi:hypothetical protein [Achromobacter sp. AONIH1]|uniref:hypothetical protein n=1 Tax=Achromobacter sp. AONIH1 TaxID=1758194 RepID=UPI001319FA55|nr:hypothetical protein [Achromobacter sp. AONIH1]
MDNYNKKFHICMTDHSNEKTTFDLVKTRYSSNYFQEPSYDQFVAITMVDSMILYALKHFAIFDDIGYEKDEWSILVESPYFCFSLRVTKLLEYLIQKDFDSFPVSTTPYTPIYSFG